MESSKWKGTGNERFKRRFFGFRSRTQLPHSNAELLRGSKKKRNEEKVKTEENCARASTREKLAKKLKSVLVQCLCEKEHRVRAPFKIPLKLMITTTTMVIVTCALNINCGE
jgi:hypothetical protein